MGSDLPGSRAAFSTWALLAGRPTLDRIEATLVLDDGTVVTNMPLGPASEIRTRPAVPIDAVRGRRGMPEGGGSDRRAGPGDELEVARFGAAFDYDVLPEETTVPGR